MNKKIKITLSLFLANTLLYASNIPKLTNSDLHSILSKNSTTINIQEIKLNNKTKENTNFKVKESIKEIKDSSYKLSSDFYKDKSKFALKDILAIFESTQAKRNKILNKDYTDIYVIKDNLDIYLNNQEYVKLQSAYSFEEFLQLINQFTGLNLSYKKENTNNLYAKIYNIGIFKQDYSNPFFKNKAYISLEPKEATNYIYGSNIQDKAFYYFKNFEKNQNKEMYFSLSENDLIALYERLLSWGVSKEYYKNILAKELYNSLTKYKNFDSKKAYNKLLENPNLSLIKDIKESLNSYNILDSLNNNLIKINIYNKQNLQEILNLLNKNSKDFKYIDTENLNLSDFKIMLNKNQVSISSLNDLEDFYFTNNKGIVAKIKAINNSYLINSSKDFIFITNKNKKQQAIYYLDKALNGAKNFRNYNFSYELFKEDINSIKNDLLK